MTVPVPRDDAVRALSTHPYLRPSFPLANRLGRQLWEVACALLFRPSPRPAHAWRAFLLRRFGARLGRGCHIYPGARIWAPWNLSCGDLASIADGAVIYNTSPIAIGEQAVISQEAYLCGATHDYDDPEFPLVSAPIEIGARAWICARATVLSGVRVGAGAVLGLGSVASADLDSWTVYVGLPARRVRSRRRQEPIDARAPSRLGRP
jgi:putative colanic acid biosynthesis acetyltransferase WcaF